MEAHLLVYLRRGNNNIRLGFFGNHLPEWKRDWYLICDRGGFILEHRSYIKRIIGCREETERADHARGKVYYITFEDIDGKKHTLKFSYESWALEFQKWFEKQTYEKENVEL